MLVLSRKKNESIVIDGNIEIEVLKIKGNTVRLGIKAPANIKVLRGELSPFGNEKQAVELVSETPVGYEAKELDRLPNPFAIANAS